MIHAIASLSALSIVATAGSAVAPIAAGITLALAVLFLASVTK